MLYTLHCTLRQPCSNAAHGQAAMQCSPPLHEHLSLTVEPRRLPPRYQRCLLAAVERRIERDGREQRIGSCCCAL